MNHLAKNLVNPFALVAVIGAAHAQHVVEHKVLTIEGAKRVAAAAVDEAKKNNATGVIAIVDEGGNPMYLERLDNTFSAGANISLGKARTAALFKKPTKAFEDIIKNGRTAMVALPDFTPLQGGVPIIVEGEIVGAIGVSGAKSAQQDEELAIAGANALAGPAAPGASAAIASPGVQASATFIDKKTVDAAFAKGSPLLELDHYKIHASRREGPGKVEVHALETDIIYVTEGTASLVTGGSVVGGKRTGPNEIRGESLDGGETRNIARGDVIVVPAGTAHWFKEVPGILTYYVVKVL
jgi:glc operon protein GlcG